MLRPFAPLIFCTLPLSAADISGAWKLDGNIADVHINRVCILKQTGNKLSGSCKNQMNDLALTGIVDGKNISWTYDSTYEGEKVTLVFKGTLESDAAMKGSIDTQGVAGAFTATKQ